VALDDRTMRVCDGHTGRQIRTVQLHKGRVTAMLALPDSRRIASGSEDGRIMVWDLNTGHNLASLAGHKDAITTLVRGWRETDVTSTSKDRTVKVWDTATRRAYLALATSERVVAIDVARKAGLVIMACDDGSLGVWDVTTTKDTWTSAGD